MTKPNGADLTFGLRRGAITGRWIWGARAIYHGGAVIDIPYDRQSHVGDITERDVKAVNGALDALRDALVERPLDPAVRGTITVPAGTVTLYADTNGSHGYLYLSVVPGDGSNE